MTDFVDGKLPSEGESAIDIVTETTTDDFFVTTTELIDFSKPKKMIYCPTCTMPPEYCQYGANFDACLPWILENCPEAISEELLAQMVGNITVTEKGEDGEAEKKKKKRGGGAAPLKKATVYDTKVVIARVQRQKRKFITVVAGLETVPDLKLKDATKLFGKKFSSGASVNETQQGAKEVVIQGDVCFDLPPLLISEFKVPPTAIFFLDDGKLTPYA